VLEHRGKRLSQSGVILHYLAATFGQIRRRQRGRATRDVAGCFWDNHKLSPATLHAALHGALAKVGEPKCTTSARAHEDLARHLDSHLQNRSFAFGDRPTIADLSFVRLSLLARLSSAFSWSVTRVSAPGWRRIRRALLRLGAPL